MRFECDCGLHRLDIDIKPLKFPKIKEVEDYIGITIYGHKSGITGKKLKKPIAQGTVVLIGKEARKFKKWISK
jgi:hypothetical protein